MEPTMDVGVEPFGEARAPLGPVVKILGDQVKSGHT